MPGGRIACSESDCYRTGGTIQVLICTVAVITQGHCSNYRAGCGVSKNKTSHVPVRLILVYIFLLNVCRAPVILGAWL